MVRQMNEEEFIQIVDANLPYGDYTQCISLIEKGAKISDNASFMVLHELCRVPRSQKEKVNNGQILALIDHWAKVNTHPVSTLVADFGKKMLLGIEVPVKDAISAMEEIRKYRGQRCALSIPYFACDDVHGKANDLYDEIEKEWGLCEKQVI